VIVFVIPVGYKGKQENSVYMTFYYCSMAKQP